RGYAVSFHAQPRATKDIDLFVEASTANARAVYAALADFGAPLASITVDDLADPAKFIRFGREPLAFDILPGIDGVDFGSAWERRVESVLDETTGLTAFLISKEDLIASKLAAGRMRDLADVEEIREAEISQHQDVQPKASDPNGLEQ
ncbi:MAG TPA: DUF6036 family nucleotidyltransferase, partial [Bryobacteraceae bacterium]|nr:DUF6036 family nucleotidyltransferase [Bryobacteraceae bacterium]